MTPIVYPHSVIVANAIKWIIFNSFVQNLYSLTMVLKYLVLFALIYGAYRFFEMRERLKSGADNHDGTIEDIDYEEIDEE